MRFQSIFTAEGEGGLSPIETDKVKSGEISTFKACSNWRHQVKHKRVEHCMVLKADFL